MYLSFFVSLFQNHFHISNTLCTFTNSLVHNAKNFENHIYSFTKPLINSNFITSIHKSKSAFSGRVSPSEISRLTLPEISNLGEVLRKSWVLPITTVIYAWDGNCGKNEKDGEKLQREFDEMRWRWTIGYMVMVNKLD